MRTSGTLPPLIPTKAKNHLKKTLNSSYQVRSLGRLLRKILPKFAPRQPSKGSGAEFRKTYQHKPQKVLFKTEKSNINTPPYHKENHDFRKYPDKSRQILSFGLPHQGNFYTIGMEPAKLFSTFAPKSLHLFVKYGAILPY